ncbi:hypothetical protein [Haliangium sp.]|uniref:hypothetical protein n=1 Tax=Haliangium sp. TaxID=2663208 RepID=UPI003D0A1EC6
MTTFHGGCHCGDVITQFTVTASANELVPRRCTCGFCTRVGPRYLSDPTGSLVLRVADGGGLIRYRFGTQTADFLMCRRCGIYLGVVCEVEGALRGVVNANTLDVELPAPAALKSFDGEEGAARLARRARTWTPAELYA